MHDIKAIRQNPEAFRRSNEMRGVIGDEIEHVLELDTEVRESKTRIQEIQTEQKVLARTHHELRLAGADEDAMLGVVAKTAARKGELQRLETNLRWAEEAVGLALLRIPNRLADDVPVGRTEADNQIIDVRQHPPRGNVAGVPHYDIPAGLDFEAGAALSGSRFTVLRGPAAKLNRAIGQFMLNNAGLNGFEEIVPPVLVNQPAMQGTGQLPKFAEDAYAVDDQWLIPTAEVSLTNLVAGAMLSEDELPLRMTALTPCFRREAGSAGRDTRGLLRQHQFEKVELVTICTPENSIAEHERILVAAEQVLTKLDLGFRRVLLCSGDTGFSAAKTYDLEVWMAGTKEYREISSCSNCHDFQAIRMNARYRPKGEKGGRFVHTLNGSGLAVGRTLAAILETYYDGHQIWVPRVLEPYLGVDRFVLK